MVSFRTRIGISSLLCSFCSCVFASLPQDHLHLLLTQPNLLRPCLVHLALLLIIPGNKVHPVVPNSLQKCDAHSLEAGTVLRIEWAPDIIVIQKIRQDEAVRDEEARLVDLEALASVRGGLGENYRRSLQAILTAAPEGLTFAEIVLALRQRQQHEVHRGTIHAILYSGGFVRKDRRWFAAPDSEAGARQLRAAFVETLLPAGQEMPAQPLSSAEYVRTRIKAIHARLSEIITMLGETRGGSTEYEP